MSSRKPAPKGATPKPRDTRTIVIYRDARSKVELRADIQRETVWATQAQIADIFGIDRTVATKHIKNLLNVKEIDTKSNVQKMHIANSDKPVTLYSLDVILAVGYRANSSRAIVFRRWASKILRDYILKGAAVNADRIKTLHEAGIRDLQAKIRFIQEIISKRELNQPEVQTGRAGAPYRGKQPEGERANNRSYNPPACMRFVSVAGTQDLLLGAHVVRARDSNVRHSNTLDDRLKCYYGIGFLVLAGFSTRELALRRQKVILLRYAITGFCGASTSRSTSC